MKDYKFLKRVAVSSDRPVLSWDHAGEIDGQKFTWAADGYRLHVVWGDQINMSGGRLQFPFSIASGDVKIPDIAQILDKCTPDTILSFDTWNLHASLKAIGGYGAAQMIITGTNLVYLTTEDSMHLQWLTDHEIPNLTEPLILNFYPRYFLQAIDKKQEITRVSLNSQDLGTPYRVGQLGSRCAFIMPMNKAMNPNYVTSMVLRLEGKQVQS